MTRPCQNLVAALTLAVLPCAALGQNALPAAAGTPAKAALFLLADEGVLDGAQLFKPETAAAAREKVRQIRQESQCAVFIDTVNNPPVSGASKANSWIPRTRTNFFRDWAKERSDEIGVEGIHVLVCKQPRHVAIVVWPDRPEAVLTPKECAGLEQLLARNLATSPDATLLATLDQIRTDLAAHRQPKPPSPPLAPIGIFLGAAVVIWLVLVVVRWRASKSDPFALTAQPQSLGLTGGLLAGMFGSPCSYWVTDRLFAQDAFAAVPPAETLAPPTAEAVLDCQEQPLEPMPEHAEMNQN